MSLDPLSADPDDLFSFMDINLDDEPVPLQPASMPAAAAASQSPPVSSPSSVPSSSSPAAAASPPVPEQSVAASTPRFLRWMVATGLLEASSSSTSSTWETSLANLQSTYQQLVQDHPFPDPPEEAESSLSLQQPHENQANTDGTTAAAVTTDFASTMDLDPLTAMVQATESEEKRMAEMDLQYRKQKALRSRGKGTARILPESEDYDESLAALQVIDKDLARLANPHGEASSTAASPARGALLRRVLFCYQCEHSNPGYRQGMHEIASYLLYALELDAATAATPGTEPVWPVALPADNEQRAAWTYHLLAHVLVGMAAAYDVGDTLPAIGRRVDHLVRTHDPLLGQRLAKLQVPPQMYFTKWIRLLFAREVSDVLEFWDEAFFGAQPGRNGTPTSNWTFLLEAWTAARLLVWSAHFMSIRDEGQLLQTLMNLPVEPETRIWCQVARDIVEKPRGPITIPPSNQQFRPALAPPPAPPPVATIPSMPTFHAPSAASVAPLKAFLSEAGTGKHLGEWMEQISSKTQILGQRVKQEFEHIAAAAAHPDPQHVYQDSSSTPKQKDSVGYNITYRSDEPALYDPPVPAPAPTPPPMAPSSRPLTRNAICKRLDQSSAILHAYLMQQQSTAQVPSTVWNALMDVQKLSRELRPRPAPS